MRDVFVICWISLALSSGNIRIPDARQVGALHGLSFALLPASSCSVNSPSDVVLVLPHVVIIQILRCNWLHYLLVGNARVLERVLVQQVTSLRGELNAIALD